MVFGLPAIGETSWGQKILDSINAVKATADAAQPAAGLDAAVAATVDDAGTATGAALEATYGTSVPLERYASLKVGDDWAPALRAAVADLSAPSGTTSMSGGEIRLPAGTVRLGSRVVFDRAVRLVADGPFTTTIMPTVGFSDTSLLRWQRHSSVTLAPGASMRDVLIDMAAVDAHAVEVFRGYDNVLFENVRVVRVPGARSAMRFTTDPADPGWSTSQTIMLLNCYAQGESDTGTGSLLYFDNCNEVTLVGTKALGGTTGFIAPRSSFHFKDCRGVALLGCSTAFATNGILVDGCEGVFATGTTVETCDVWLRTQQTGASSNRWIEASRPRVEGGAGGAAIAATTDSWIDYAPVTVGAGCSNNRLQETESVFVPAFSLQSYTGAPVFGNAGVVPAWLLADAATDGVQGGGIRIPTHWATFRVSLLWSNPGASSGNIVLVGLRGVVPEGGDLGTAGMVSGVWTLSAPAQNGLKKDVLTTGITATDSAYVTYRLYRDGGNAADTLPNAAGLIGFLLERES